MNAYETLKAALAEKSTLLADLSAAQALLAERETRIAGLDSELAAALNEIGLRDAKIASASAELEARASLLAEKETAAAELARSLAALSAEKAALEVFQRDTDAEVAAAIADKLAGLGFEASSLPANSTTAKTEAELRAEWQSIKDPTERASFYAKNKSALTTA